MRLKAKPVIAGFAVIVAGALLIYFAVPLIERYITPEDWKRAGGSLAEVTFGSLFCVFGLAGYVSGRLSKLTEWLYGCVISLSILFLLILINLVAPELSSPRLPVPIFSRSWWALPFTLFYCIAPLGGAGIAEDENKKKKPDPAEAVVDIVTDGIDVVSDIYKHIH